MLFTRSPLSLAEALDLHVWTTPLAFTLSQDQTLRKIATDVALFEVCLWLYFLLKCYVWLNITINSNFWPVARNRTWQFFKEPPSPILCRLGDPCWSRFWSVLNGKVDHSELFPIKVKRLFENFPIFFQDHKTNITGNYTSITYGKTHLTQTTQKQSALLKTTVKNLSLLWYLITRNI